MYVCMYVCTYVRMHDSTQTHIHTACGDAPSQCEEANSAGVASEDDALSMCAAGEGQPPGSTPRAVETVVLLSGLEKGGKEQVGEMEREEMQGQQWPDARGEEEEGDGEGGLKGEQQPWVGAGEDDFQVHEDVFVAAWVQTWAERGEGEGRGGRGGRCNAGEDAMQVSLMSGGSKARRAVLPRCPCLFCREEEEEEEEEEEKKKGNGTGNASMNTYADTYKDAYKDTYEDASMDADDWKRVWELVSTVEEEPLARTLTKVCTWRSKYGLSAVGYDRSFRCVFRVRACACVRARARARAHTHTHALSHTHTHTHAVCTLHTRARSRCVFQGCITGVFDNFVVLDLDVLVPLEVFASPSEPVFVGVGKREGEMRRERCVNSAYTYCEVSIRRNLN